jgi:hypothetical protein
LIRERAAIRIDIDVFFYRFYKYEHLKIPFFDALEKSAAM